MLLTIVKNKSRSTLELCDHDILELYNHGITLGYDIFV